MEMIVRSNVEGREGFNASFNLNDGGDVDECVSSAEGGVCGARGFRFL